MAFQLLVAEKSPVVKKLINTTFPEPEYILHFFDDGEEALKAISSLSPDVVICRLSLPSKDGYEIARFLQEQDKIQSMGLILLHGAFEPADEEKLSTFFYDALIQEPFDSQELLKQVREIIDSKRMPQTFPEEPVIEERSSTIEIRLSEPVKEALSREILEMERELEKRLRQFIRSEIMDWLEKKIPESEQDKKYSR